MDQGWKKFKETLINMYTEFYKADKDMENNYDYKV